MRVARRLSFIRQPLTSRSPVNPPNETLFIPFDQLLAVGRSSLLRAFTFGTSRLVTLAWRSLKEAHNTDRRHNLKAANSAMLGCFQPNCKCMDNIIHDIACAAIHPEKHRHRLHTSWPKLTPGFFSLFRMSAKASYS
ncbi:hypothetical protein H310_01286 [Aphanomyces invadans]|uniref:Uncharacterized protein n=1 Tax=Aphanomyces invadans TaxID=157072 RepID=A0A024USX4_9STRA|nr:hypothetical protein H310_01286 [Aphanomyces invadans]ETW08768.1 hypothetical protein H310_01286 [Aphanomyces invadans]|eukprot:XP_008862573.1 hypothetical protein H310_01286 [Aphanomyces invadans]